MLCSRIVPAHELLYQLAGYVLMRLMRPTQVYAVSAYPSFGTTAPSEREALRGDVRIGFSCDPVAGNAAALAELALAEVERLQARSSLIPNP